MTKCGTDLDPALDMVSQDAQNVATRSRDFVRADPLTTPTETGLPITKTNTGQQLLDFCYLLCYSTPDPTAS